MGPAVLILQQSHQMPIDGERVWVYKFTPVDTNQISPETSRWPVIPQPDKGYLHFVTIENVGHKLILKVIGEKVRELSTKEKMRLV